MLLPAVNGVNEAAFVKNKLFRPLILLMKTLQNSTFLTSQHAAVLAANHQKKYGVD